MVFGIPDFVNALSRTILLIAVPSNRSSPEDGSYLQRVEPNAFHCVVLFEASTGYDYGISDYGPVEQQIARCLISSNPSGRQL